MQLRGSQIDEKPEFFPDTEQPFFGAYLGRKPIPFRTAYGAEDDAVACEAGIDGFLGQGGSACVDGGSSDQGFAVGEFMPEALRYLVKAFLRFGDDFRSDAVSF